MLRLGPGATFSNQTADYFSPQDYSDLDSGDTDLGSTAPILFDFNDPATGLRHLVWEMGKTDNAYLLDRDNLGGVNGQLSGPGVSSGWLFGSYAAYTTPLHSYVTFNGGASCGGDLIAMQINPSSGNKNIEASVAWCATIGSNQAAIVSTSDGTNDYIVWGLGNGLTALDGDTGNTLGNVNVPGSFEHWVIPIVANHRIFVVGDNNAWAFVP